LTPTGASGERQTPKPELRERRTVWSGLGGNTRIPAARSGYEDCRKVLSETFQADRSRCLCKAKRPVRSGTLILIWTAPAPILPSFHPSTLPFHILSRDATVPVSASHLRVRGNQLHSIAGSLLSKSGLIGK